MPRGFNDTTDLPCLDRLAPNLSALMAKRGLSTWELAEKSGVCQTIVWRLARGRKSNPHLSTVLRLCRALGVSVGTLLKGES